MATKEKTYGGLFTDEKIKSKEEILTTVNSRQPSNVLRQYQYWRSDKGLRCFWIAGIWWNGQTPTEVEVLELMVDVQPRRINYKIFCDQIDAGHLILIQQAELLLL